jgi:type II secretory pathway pseudopilin PulG
MGSLSRSKLSRRIGAGEAGFSLLELMAAQALFLLVIGAALALLNTQRKVAPRDEERAFALREAQVGLANLVRDLRGTKTVVFASPSRFEVELVRNGVLRRVGYKCDQASTTDDPANPYDQAYLRCSRVEGPAGASLPSYAGGRTVIARLLSGAVFSYSPDSSNPTYVSVTLRVPSRGERKESNSNDVVLTDGFFMPNRSNLG